MARRIVAAVSSVPRVSTEALEDGIVDHGLDCLFKLYRYQTDEKYRSEVDEDKTLPGILEVGKGIYGALAAAFSS